MITQEKIINKMDNKSVKIVQGISKVLRFFNSLIPFKITISSDSQMADYIYLTICKQDDFDMVAASVYTLYKNSSLIPKKICLISDGSWELAVGIEYFKKYGLNIEAKKWECCASYYHDKCPQLEKWAQNHVWGKKMASILYYSETDRVLFSDPDVLWYGTPLTGEEISSINFKVSIDNSHNYDNNCIKNLGYEFLYTKNEPINCGVIFIHGGLKLLSDKSLKCINFESEHFGNFAEQTVFALMHEDYNCTWTMEEITSEITDIFPRLFKKTIFYDNMFARHYLWFLKWIYWKDFLKQRFF